MAFVEIKTYKFTCDKCGKEEIVQGNWFHRPVNWEIRDNNWNPYAMFHYEQDICPDCVRGK